MATAVAGDESAPRRWRLRLPERLPDLKGRWLRLYTIIWAIMLPLAMFGAVRGTYIVLTIPPMWSPYGLGTVEDTQGLRVYTVNPAPRAKGIEVGDYVVAIDGWTVPDFAPRAAAKTHVVKPDGTGTTFTIRKPNGERREVRLTYSWAVEEQGYRDAGVDRSTDRFINGVGAALVPAILLPAAILMFIRCRREAVPAMLSLAFLMIAGIFNSGSQLGIDADIVTAIGSIATCLLFASLFAFPSGEFVPRWTAIPFILVPILPFLPLDGIVGPTIGVMFSLLAVTVLISRYRRVGAGPEWLQLRWAFFGLAIGIAIFIFTTVTDAMTLSGSGIEAKWVNRYLSYVNPLLGGGLYPMAIGLIVSILRYRLYDANAVIGRSAAYAMLTLGFVVLFAGSQKIIELIGQEYLGQNIGGIAGGIGAALAAVAIAPMHNRAQRWAERRFQNNLYRLRRGLPALVGDLRETSGIEKIAGATLDALVDGVQASRAAMIAGEKIIDARHVPAAEVREWWTNWTPAAHDGIDCDRADRLFPVRVPLEAEGHGRVGWLLLGARPDGSMFGKSEYDAMEEIAEPVARALEVAMTRAEREARYEHRFELIETQLSRLAQLIDELRSQPRGTPA